MRSWELRIQEAGGDYLIVKIPKDIDATEAKIFKGMSLRKGMAAMAALAVFTAGQFALHLPVLVTAAFTGLVMFLGIFEKQGMNAPTICLRVAESVVTKRRYMREAVASATIKSPKQVKKDAVSWNKWLRREKKRKPELVAVKAVRCTKNKKTRK